MSAPSTDVELVARVLARDGGAFAELVRRHQAGLRRLLWRLACGNAALADDLAQDTFLRAYRGLASYRGGSFPAWLYRIAYNVYASAARSGKLGAFDAGDGGGALDGDAIGAPGPLRLDLEAALARLRPEERIAVALTLGRELTHEDAARILGWPLGTLKSHVARGRDKLMDFLRGWKDDR